ncbi:hypothetical protein DQM17_08720 [Lacticaseibacillus paracasei]|nr:hypothetical protein DQM17_08720 [Lacticaseibacillus paracasei]
MLAQKPTHKDLGRNGQNLAITPKAAYAPVSIRSSSRSCLFVFTKKYIYNDSLLIGILREVP